MDRRATWALVLALCWLIKPAAAQDVIAMLDSQQPGAAGGGSVTYLLDENFEGTGTPTDWFGTADYDSVSSPLQGAQSCRITAGPNVGAYTLASDQTEIWGKMLYRISALPGSFSDILILYDSGIFKQMQISILSDGTLVVTDTGGTIFDTTTDAMAANTVYYIWWHYKKGSGANAVCEVWWNTTDTRPASMGSKWAGGSNGDSTGDIKYPIYGGAVQAGNTDIDVAQIAATDFQ